MWMCAVYRVLFVAAPLQNDGIPEACHLSDNIQECYKVLSRIHIFEMEAVFQMCSWCIHLFLTTNDDAKCSFIP